MSSEELNGVVGRLVLEERAEQSLELLEELREFIFLRSFGHLHEFKCHKEHVFTESFH